MAYPLLPQLTVIPAEILLSGETRVPEAPGVYLMFFRGGRQLLAATSYFDLDGRPTHTVRGRSHLYTGAADNLRRRLKQHMSQINGSSLRRTLLAIELGSGAISRSETPDCAVRGELTLTRWMRSNVLVGVRLTKAPFELERRLLAAHPSPFNLALRRRQKYAKALSALRQSVFPSGDTWKIGALGGK
jgi:predicted GIY-YIG superfamily endonuclease